ncbi:hypothetical protein SAMN04487820_101202 [Actinopolyspora mzabensis]|uniref:Uncharacterized protein n=1 Tax=Actinopolyspora mzabensis TaxID=995066 RepID=A0A1G8VMY2_ACTMZ|nr:hypothetical protein [Actinopolyspora mzabensis]SDJ67421.1 hypothetical protein SAMN04487820_101202 [Actinopolyspora mzabensis]
MVQVRGYVKKDGTEVSPHTRSAPGGGGTPTGSLGILVAVVISLAVLGVGGETWRPGTPGEPARTTWRHGGSTFTVVNSEESASCSNLSYGRVAEFFEEHPCRKLRRTLLRVADEDGEPMVVAVSRTTMPTTRSAKWLRKLVDTPGTGNLAELSRGSPSLTKVDFTGTHYASTREGSTVTVSEATPRRDSSTPERSALHEAARAALLYPDR